LLPFSGLGRSESPKIDAIGREQGVSRRNRMTSLVFLDALLAR
jgi:hypothetical protein